MGFFFDNHDDADKIVAVQTVERSDLDALARHCADMRHAGTGNRKDEKLAMSVDGWVINDWCVKRGVTFATFMRDQKLQTQFIEDPDNAAFRVWGGKL